MVCSCFITGVGVPVCGPLQIWMFMQCRKPSVLHRCLLMLTTLYLLQLHALLLLRDLLD